MQLTLGRLRALAELPPEYKVVGIEWPDGDVWTAPRTLLGRVCKAMRKTRCLVGRQGDSLVFSYQTDASEGRLVVQSCENKVPRKKTHDIPGWNMTRIWRPARPGEFFIEKL